MTGIPAFVKKDLKALSLRANFSWTFFGNVIYAGTQWGLTILMTKFFDPAVFGRFSLALSIVTPIFTASALQLRAVLVSDPEGEVPFTHYLVLRWITCLLALLVSILVGVVGGFPPELFALVICLGLGQGAILIKDLYQGVMQRKERMDLASISRIYQGVVSLGAAVLLSILTRNALFVAVGMFIGRGLVLFFFDIPYATALSPARGPSYERAALTQSFRPAEIYALARLAFPLGLATLLTSLYADIPNYFLAGAFGERVVGFFAAVATTMSLEEIVVSALGQSALHRLAYFYAHSRPSFRYLLARLVLIGIGTGLAGVLVSILWGGDLLRIFFREEYAGFTHVLVWLMIARGVLNVYSFLGYGMTAARKFKVQVWVSGLMTGSLFLACWQLVPRFSGQGAAWSISISACVGLVMAALVLGKASFLPVKISM